MESIVIWGAGGHAKVVAQSLRRLKRWTIKGFIDDVSPERAGQAFAGASVLGGREIVERLRAEGQRCLVFAFGRQDIKLALAPELSRKGWSFPIVVDDRSAVADDAALGEGCYVAAGAVVQPGATIGAHAIVNTGAIVDHDCVIGDAAHVCPRVCLAGHVVVGRGAWVGAGATVRDRVRIGDAAVVGIGSLVLDDVADGWVSYGHPAKPVRKVQA